MLTRIIVTVTFMLAMASARAEVLSLPSDTEEPAGDRDVVGMSLPARGMTMKQVEAKYGQPRSRTAAVGEPPITRWLYDRYTVYFEHQYVIHTVLNR